MCPFNHRPHDQLMADVQTVKHAQSEHRRTLNLCIIGSVE
jgi:hypothetical protein